MTNMEIKKVLYFVEDFFKYYKKYYGVYTTINAPKEVLYKSPGFNNPVIAAVLSACTGNAGSTLLIKPQFDNPSALTHFNTLPIA